MKYLVKHIAMISLVCGITACSHDEDAPNEQAKTPLTVISKGGQGGNDPDGDYIAFKAKDQIRVYYAHSNLNTVYEHLQGVYEFPENKEKDDYWDNTTLNPKYGGDNLYSIFTEDIKRPNDDSRYVFTATSYPEPLAAGYDYLYKVHEDQQAQNYESSDFVAARAVYYDESWKEPGKGISLKFRHLLCRLDVEIILPKQQYKGDGLFENPMKLEPTATLLNRYTHYSVLFNNHKKDGEIFVTKTHGNATDVAMYKDPDCWQEPVSYNNSEAAAFRFSVILPEQTFIPENSKEEEWIPLIRFDIDGMKFIYRIDPDQRNLITLQQEKVRRIRLVMLINEGAQRVILNKISLVDWKKSEAHIGELIPETKTN